MGHILLGLLFILIMPMILGWHLTGLIFLLGCIFAWAPRRFSR